MAAVLPPALLKLFAPRPPIEYWPHPDDFKKKSNLGLNGVASYMSLLNQKDDYVPEPTMKDKVEILRKEKRKRFEEKLAKAIAEWNPSTNPNIKSDPIKTLFVARLSFETTEKTIFKEFEQFGPISSVILVCTPEGKSRGYAFVEFEREKDMKVAYREADGLRIDGRRILVDVERGRTVKGWKPRRLGGGLGAARLTGWKLKTSSSNIQPPRDSGKSSISSRNRSRSPRRENGRYEERRYSERDRPRDRDRYN